MSLDAAVRVEDALSDRLLRTELPVGGSQQCKAPAFTVHGVLPGRKRHVSPSIATFPHCEANEFHPAERACIGFEDHLRVASFPAGVPCSFGMIFTDTSSPLDLDMVVLQDCRGPETDGSGWFARVLRTPANRGETHGPRGECVVTGFVINTTICFKSQYTLRYTA